MDLTNKFLLVDMFAKNNSVFINVALRNALFGKSVNEMKITEANLIIDKKTHHLTSGGQGTVTAGNVVYKYFEIPRELLTAAVESPQSYLLINTTKGEIHEDIAEKCPAHHKRHSHGTYQHNHTEFAVRNNNPHVLELHTDAEAYSSRYPKREIKNVCAQMQAMLKKENELARETIT